MRKLVRTVLLSAAVASSAAFAAPNIRFAARPTLAPIAPNIEVVANFNGEVYFAAGAYWSRQGPAWYRSNNDGRWAWYPVPANQVPPELVRLPPGRYRNYHPWNPPYRWANRPPMAQVAPGVQVVQDTDDEVFLDQNAYWSRRDGQWFRANNDGRWQWELVAENYVPRELIQIPFGRYRHYRPGPQPGAFGPQIRFAGRPELVPVGAGVSVVPDYDGEVFFANASFWTRAPDGRWYRAGDDGRWIWQPTDVRFVPQLLVQMPIGRYRRYHYVQNTYVPPVRFAARPALVQIAPGVSVVPDFDTEVFFDQGAFWLRANDGRWYWAADDGRWNWQPTMNQPIPPELAQLTPGQYRRYQPGPWSPQVRFDDQPQLVDVSAGVKVIQDYGQEVYLSHGAYWMRHDDDWYRARADGRWDWQPVSWHRVPSAVRHLKAGLYVNYHPWVPNFQADDDPDLVRIGHGVEVIPDLDQEIFFAKGSYWCRHDDDWFQAKDDGDWDWHHVHAFRVPRPLRHLEPGQYIHYHPDENVEPASWHHRHHDRDEDRDRGDE